MYDPLGIPCLAVICFFFVFVNAKDCNSCIYYTWQLYLFFLIYDHLHIPCLADMILFFFFVPITFEMLHKCKSIQNTNAHEMLSANQKHFTFVNFISSFKCIIP